MRKFLLIFVLIFVGLGFASGAKAVDCDIDGDPCSVADCLDCHNVTIGWDALDQADINALRSDCTLSSVSYTVTVTGKGSKTTSGTSWSISSLTGDTTYTWKVRSDYQCTISWKSGLVWTAIYSFKTPVCGQPPYIESQKIEYEEYCTPVKGRGQIGFSWIYRDDDGDTESQFDFRVNDVNWVSDPNPEVDKNVSGLSYPDSHQNNQAVLVVPSPGADEITYGKTYYWWARVWEDKGGNSGWVSGPPFDTEDHAWPYPKFTHQPQYPAAEQVVTFFDDSTCFDSLNDTCSCSEINPNTGIYNTYGWDFSYETADGFNLEDAKVGDTNYSYDVAGDYTVMLRVTDDLGTCDTTGDTPVEIRLPLPEYKEVAPISWLKKIFAGVADLFNGFLKF